MLRYFLELSFKGTKFSGWQIQDNANSVQAEINKALTVLCGTPTECTGCGRTDTGVHALQFFTHFDISEMKDAQQFLFQLNSILPFDIVIHQLHLVHDDAHARYDARARTYQYFIHQNKNPFINEYSWHRCYDFDLMKMNEACQLLFSHEDFSCFSKSNHQQKTNLCNITEAKWVRQNDLIIFTITSNRFLRGMVRAIVGTILQVGTNKMRMDEINNVLKTGDRKEAGASVPAHGLFLTKIDYPYLQSSSSLITFLNNVHTKIL